MGLWPSVLLEKFSWAVMGETLRLQEHRQNIHSQSRKQQLGKAPDAEETTLKYCRFTQQTTSFVALQYKLFQAHSLQLSGEHHFPVPSPRVLGYDKLPDSWCLWSLYLTWKVKQLLWNVSCDYFSRSQVLNPNPLGFLVLKPSRITIVVNIDNWIPKLETFKAIHSSAL